MSTKQMESPIGDSEEYFIAFDTKSNPGKIVGVRVRLDLVTITDNSALMRVDLCQHPLYKELKEYVEAN